MTVDQRSTCAECGMEIGMVQVMRGYLRLAHKGVPATLHAPRLATSRSSSDLLPGVVRATSGAPHGEEAGEDRRPISYPGRTPQGNESVRDATRFSEEARVEHRGHPLAPSARALPLSASGRSSAEPT